VNSHSSAPSAAIYLGYAGAIPFVAGALATFPISGSLREWGVVLLLNYGAIILSFMGGVHWGAAMLRDDSSLASLGKSVAPALLALVATLFGGKAGLLLLASGFAGLLIHDQRETAAGRLPAWYPSLRRPLSAIVISALILGVIGTTL
jgi:hypothetical protein